MEMRERKNGGSALMRLRLLGVSCVLLMVTASPVAVTQQSPPNKPQSPLMIDGQILFAPMYSKTTYLINRSGVVNHTWTSDYFPGEGVRWLGDGTILRTMHIGSWSGGAGGGIQIIKSDGTIVWEYHYYTSSHCSHHDARMLPNGNVLLIAWEFKTRNEAIANGRNPSLLSGTSLWPEHIIEVQPTGPTNGTVVWEWHVWDHLIQDYNASLPNYGVVANHPELIDINYCETDSSDWLHCNSIDYNAQFDQILLSIRYFSEVWVIDHSTTTQEAAGHTGGHYDHGGDLLYRWGNPQTYQAGTSSDQVFYWQHDAQWIRAGCPGAGHIMVFNNGVFRNYSSVDEFAPPVNADGSYYLDPGYAYGPTSLTWSYTADPPSSFYSSYGSGAERLTDGDTMICDSDSGHFFEVTPQKAVVWQYDNPYPGSGQNSVFKIVFIPPNPPAKNPNLTCTGSLSWTKVKPGDTVNGSFTVRNIGDPGSQLNWTVNASSLTWGTWSFSPASGTNLTPEAGSINVSCSVVAPKEKNQAFQGYLTVQNSNNASDYDVISISLTTPTNLDDGCPGWALLHFLRSLLIHTLDYLMHLTALLHI